MSDIDSEVGRVQLIDGSCNADEALYECGSTLFDGDAAGRTRILIVLMAGESSGDVRNAAQVLKTAGVKMISIGVGNSFDRSQLSAISSPHVLTTGTFGGLPGVSESVCSLVSRGTFTVENFHLAKP